MSQGLTREQAKKKLVGQDEKMIFEIIAQYGVIVDNVKRVEMSKRIVRWFQEKK